MNKQLVYSTNPVFLTKFQELSRYYKKKRKRIYITKELN